MHTAETSIISIFLHLCYKSFVRPIIDCYSAIWSPYTLCNINEIEATQRRAARFVLNDSFKYSSVTDMLNKLSWQPLQIRRSSQLRQMVL